MRVAFKMYLKPDVIEEYTKRHNEIWADLVILLKEAGLSEYSIFVDKKKNELFAFHKLSKGQGAADLGKEEIVQKWWEYMADIMETNADYSPVVEILDEVFYLP